jgi:hypothetical protein
VIPLPDPHTAALALAGATCVIALAMLVLGCAGAVNGEPARTCVGLFCASWPFAGAYACLPLWSSPLVLVAEVAVLAWYGSERGRWRREMERELEGPLAEIDRVRRGLAALPQTRHNRETARLCDAAEGFVRGMGAPWTVGDRARRGGRARRADDAR